MPIWIELHGLDFKYWGMKSLSKIVGVIGKFMRLNQATMNRETLSFARMLVEMKVDQVFPDILQFKNEKGCVVDQPVYYHWKPIICLQCHRYGHYQMDYINKQNGAKTRKVWVAKQPQGVQSDPVVDTRGNGRKENVDPSVRLIGNKGVMTRIKTYQNPSRSLESRTGLIS